MVTLTTLTSRLTLKVEEKMHGVCNLADVKCAITKDIAVVYPLHSGAVIYRCKNGGVLVKLI